MEETTNPAVPQSDLTNSPFYGVDIRPAPEAGEGC